MTNRKRSAGKAKSVPAGMGISAFMSMGITLILSVVIAYFLNNETITWAQAGYWIMGMLFTASFIGSKCAYGAIRQQHLLVSVMSGILYWGLLLIGTALFFGGKFGAVWETAGIIAAGSCSAALLSKPFTGNNGGKKKRSYR